MEDGMDPANVLRREMELVIDDDARTDSTNYTGDFLIALGLLAVSDALYELNENVRMLRHEMAPR